MLIVVSLSLIFGSIQLFDDNGNTSIDLNYDCKFTFCRCKTDVY